MSAKALPQLLFVSEALDRIETTCMVLPFLADEKPLRGVAGLADWRMNGKISQQLLAERITGKSRETVLIPSAHRLRAQNLLLLGLGPRAEVNEKSYQACLAHLGAVLNKARLPKFTFALNTELSAPEQVAWLADFAEHETSLLWEIMAPGEAFPACEAVLKKDFSKGLSFRFAAAKFPERNDGSDR